MSRIAYVNGRYLPRAHACVDIEDRGFQFADGVYEVCQVQDGLLVDEERHLARLQRSLSELRIRMPMTETALRIVLRETIARNLVRDGIVYLQVTRGSARRDFPFPDSKTPPTLVVTARSNDPGAVEHLAEQGIAVITVPDVRWGRVDIKSVGLLPNVLAKQAARDRGAREAWLVDSAGEITEGASSNAWIVARDGTLVTRKVDHHILRGVTRTTLLDAIAAMGLTLAERGFTVEEALAAREAFVTSASQTVMPVVKIDGQPVGTGSPGPLTRALRRDFHRFAQST